jgi:hypothetical protein
MIMGKIMIASSFFFCTLLASIDGLALTPQQVIDLKKAGVSDQTIQMMIRQEEGNDPYAAIGTREVKDKNGNTIIIYTTGNGTNSAADEEEKQKVKRAWEMLNNIIIDKRNKK